MSATEGNEESAAESAAGRPFLQIVRGEPTAEEVAALVAVLTARAQAAAAARQAAEGAGRKVSRWSDRSRSLRGPVVEGVRPRGPGAWRASGLPR
ncbi:acyl-CoA carboxylase subunit epsilon [Actinomadura barringtoniae]|uniref:Acyl-CoA carboxylase subunit epsilon n=1 Tax=Actinomadura barringtoniae TaxID=1427535 RepID=A0A939PG46_9ACTN|nr:acyl-CoA carboxylase subunit epsilon [Actinomadura barringtoniae]MBO2452040.1 acyl-CoA carboxylase subunit epsilon [Actinomadura barringtoniae]